jgi:hypothetical protein
MSAPLDEQDFDFLQKQIEVHWFGHDPVDDELGLCDVLSALSPVSMMVGSLNPNNMAISATISGPVNPIGN